MHILAVCLFINTKIMYVQNMCSNHEYNSHLVVKLCVIISNLLSLILWTLNYT